jgi:hypothetical protein
MKDGTNTPWGKSQGSSFITLGVEACWTASHGGIRVSKEKAAKMPPDLRAIGGMWELGALWFEEDCAWCAVVLSFPAAFEPYVVENAKKTLKQWYPDTALPPEGSTFILAL